MYQILDFFKASLKPFSLYLLFIILVYLFLLLFHETYQPYSRTKIPSKKYAQSSKQLTRANKKPVTEAPIGTYFKDNGVTLFFYFYISN